jgi:hypothetical protein
MELMASCFDKLLKLIRQPIPEFILGKLTFSVNFLFCIMFYSILFFFGRQSLH